VLTTPIIRCLKATYPDSEIHFLTKKKFESILKHNPYLHQLHTFEQSIDECLPTLKANDFNFVIDLHNNLRSRSLLLKLNRPSAKFNKLNFKKWLLVNFKVNRMPDIHIVDRYFDTLKTLGVANDKKGLDFYLPQTDFDCIEKFGLTKNNYMAIAIGAAHFTKQIPESKILELIAKTTWPIVLLGDKNDLEKANNIITQSENKNVKSACGNSTLYESAYIIKHAKLVVTADTGLMHIASAFNKIIYSFWGNTVPEFGMSPYKPNTDNKIFEVKNLNCRPCSKIGFDQCPKGHFNCMNKIDLSAFSIQD
jgi:ADP-heptose:LPS heptosyltransferase